MTEDEEMIEDKEVLELVDRRIELDIKILCNESPNP